MKMSRLSMSLLVLAAAGAVGTAASAEQTDPHRADALGSTGAIVRATLIGQPVSGEPAVAVQMPALAAESDAQRASRERGSLQHWARLMPAAGRPAKAP